MSKPGADKALRRNQFTARPYLHIVTGIVPRALARGVAGLSLETESARALRGSSAAWASDSTPPGPARHHHPALARS